MENAEGLILVYVFGKKKWCGLIKWLFHPCILCIVGKKSMMENSRRG